jgi:hypothetical protein
MDKRIAMHDRFPYSDPHWVLYRLLRAARRGPQADPRLALVGRLRFLIQWLAFIPAILQTEKVFDLTGSVTYISVITFALIFSSGMDTRFFFYGLWW